MRVLLTGGGTGGHVYPALAVAMGLRQRGRVDELLYIGASRGLEAQLVPREDIPLALLTVEGLPRKLSPRILRALFRLGTSYKEARRLVEKFRPDVAVGTGGYVCAPVVLAAYRMGIPVVLHEQNALPGLTNRLLARWAQAVCLTFPEAAPYFPRCVIKHVTGLPVRPEILVAAREEGVRDLGLAPGRRLVLVVGGSQGASALNRAMLEVWLGIREREDCQLLHITGKANLEETLVMARRAGINREQAGNITILPYLYQMPQALAAAEMVIGRAGAAFLAEITVRGLPGILIPYPHAAANHQEYNARSLTKAGAAVLLPEAELTGKRLWREVERFLETPGLLAGMSERSRALGKPEALEEILNIVEDAACRKKLL